LIERSTFELQVPSDPALAVTVRTFVRTSAPLLGLSEEDVETLCLAATELLANAVEHGQPSLDLVLSAEGGRWKLQANGVGPLDVVAGEPIDRRALLSGIAAVAVDDGGGVELSAVASE
jgi:two-component sensor histidine kinase